MQEWLEIRDSAADSYVLVSGHLANEAYPFVIMNKEVILGSLQM